ncbi:MAG: divergent polysaccharide deacetylase family protein [Candidatus Edwardsbacteria bacterium]
MKQNYERSNHRPAQTGKSSQYPARFFLFKRRKIKGKNRSSPWPLFVVFLLLSVGAFFLWSNTKTDYRRNSVELEIMVEQELQKLGFAQRRIVQSDSTLVREIIEIPDSVSLIACNLAISQVVKRQRGKIVSAEEDRRRRRLLLKFAIKTKPPQNWEFVFVQKKEEKVIKKAKRIALVIDDFGNENNSLIQSFLNFAFPLTLAILPNARYAKLLALEAVRKQKEVILHLPMEPKGYPQEDPGEGAIFVDLTNSEIRKRLKRNLESVPEAKGVSNHMGSRATEDPVVMTTVLKQIKKRNLYFLDSKTTPYSVVQRVAQKLEAKTAESRFFFDEKDDYISIKDRLEQLVRIAEKEGQAIGIGHLKLNTLIVLKEVLPKLKEEGFEFVFVSELAK